MNFRLGCAVTMLVTVVGCQCQSEVRVGPNADASVGGGSGGGSTGGGTGGGGGGLPPPMATDGGCGLVTCDSANAECGLIGDGCGAVLDCGACRAPQTCGGGGVPSTCGGTGGCIPKTCSDLGAECGPMADGCGGLLDCGTCIAPESCGGGGLRARCGLASKNVGDGGACIPMTCQTLGAECGVVGDGCGNVAVCGTCDTGKACGGGGVPYHCGGGNNCVQRTCPVGACGAYGDGCGGILMCGGCNSPQTCGGGGVANECGGGMACVPKDLNSLLPDGGCGFVGDGCGGILDAGVGVCPPPLTCGASGVPNQCGGSVTCVARTCASAGVNCGTIGDGCGATVDCGGCDAGTCGGGGVANVCGSRPACVPKTCAELNKNCGQVGDGCGGLTADCGTCTAPDICGGAGIPSVCGSIVPDAGVACTNLCLNQTCAATKLKGTVLAPTDPTQGYGNPDPIPHALVYVPNGTVMPFDAGVSCDRCTDSVSGSPLISTYSNTDGTFELSNVPCGVDVPVVFQLGRWRRQITVTSVQCCMTTTLTAAQTHLPRRQAEGHPNDNIPLTAIITGSADSIENVFPKIGVDQTPASGQYSNPGGTGRVRFYRDNGFNFGGNSPAATTLYNDLNELKKYDMVVLDCVGGEQLKTPAARANIEAYANAGGRVFASHYSYVWLFGDAIDPGGNRISSPNSFTPTATWKIEQDRSDQGYDAYIDLSFSKGVTFAEWLQLPSVNAQAPTSTPAVPRIHVSAVRHDIDAVNAPAQRWVFRAPCKPTTCSALGYSCGNNIPDGCGGTIDCGGCGRRDRCGGGGTPGQCGRNGTCQPKTCASLGFVCGNFSDGCGNTLNCGTCSNGSNCGGGGVAGQCGNSSTQIPLEYTFNTPTSAAAADQCGRVLFSDFHVTSGGYFSGDPAAPMTAQEKVFEYLIFDLSSCIQPDVTPPQMCTPKTCADQGLNCGAAADGCGNTYASCGTCTPPATCGGGGTPGVCGAACTPRTCTQQGFDCGPQGDGCGGTIQCGTCSNGQTCGGGGLPGVCGGGACVPKTCDKQDFNCGLQSDGCGGILSCGTCTAPDTCGGGGVPGRCGGGSTCTVKTCTQLGFNCGQQTDGCGGTQDCGTCTAPATCGGGGLPGVCGGGGTCNPRTCAQQGFDCGLQGDGCGGQISCGTCANGQTCGAVNPGVCGTASCKPLTCAEQSLSCGPAGDGCGNLIQCGSCPAGQTCGGGGQSGVCGTQPCTPRTCDQVGANCGPIADGCGNTVDCGTCTGLLTCGGAGTPNVCGSIN